MRRHLYLLLHMLASFHPFLFKYLKQAQCSSMQPLEPGPEHRLGMQHWSPRSYSVGALDTYSIGALNRIVLEPSII